MLLSKLYSRQVESNSFEPAVCRPYRWKMLLPHEVDAGLESGRRACSNSPQLHEHKSL